MILPLFVIDTCQVAMDDGVIGAQIKCPQISSHSSGIIIFNKDCF
jgi:hypothetical protein